MPQERPLDKVSLPGVLRHQAILALRSLHRLSYFGFLLLPSTLFCLVLSAAEAKTVVHKVARTR